MKLPLLRIRCAVLRGRIHAAALAHRHLQMELKFVDDEPSELRLHIPYTYC